MRLIALITLAVAALMLATESLGATVRDEFNAVSFGGNNGSANWSSDWQEQGESDGSGSGEVRVESSAYCAAGNCMLLDGAQGQNNHGVSRQADLSGAVSATLTFSYRRESGGGQVELEISDDGGTGWTTLATYTLTAGDPAQVSQSFDILAYATANTQIRFTRTGGSRNSFLYFDNVEIDFAAGLPHFSISHDGNADTCAAENVTIAKHDASHAVDTGYAGTITLSTSTSNGDWSLVAGSGMLTNSGGGGGTYAYAPADNGVVVLGLASSIEETLNIDVIGGGESEDSIEDPDLTFANLVAQTFRDEFNVVAFSNNDGTANWANDWQEIGEADGAGAGDILVFANLSDNRLRIRDNDNGGEGVWREVDLSAFTSATLSFDYRRQNLDDSGDHVTLEVYDGSTWTELTRFEGPDDDGTFQSFSQDISAFIAPNTRVRLLGSSALGPDDRVWFDNVEISASASAPCVSVAAAGFVLAHDGQGIHCLSEPVGVTVIDATLSVVPDYDAPVTLTTQSGRGTWALVTGAGVFDDGVADDGVATYDFEPADLGTAAFTLSYPEGASPIDVDVYQTNDITIRDDDSEGALSFAPSGFTLTASALGNPPPSPINDPLGTQIAGTDFPLHVAAYGVTDDDPLCGVIESYAGDRPLKFFMSYDDPGSGTRAATVDGSDTGTGLAQTVTFTAGQAQVLVKYKDAGAISLTVQDDASFPNVLAGGTNSFVVKPATLVVSRIESAGGAPNLGAGTVTGAQFVPAGEAFVVDVEARDAEGALTPNFGLETVPETILLRSANLVLPVGGRNGSTGDVLNGASFVATGTAGRFTNTSVRFDEIGVIQLQAEVAGGDYLGAGPVSGTLSGNVGRFYPGSFELISDTLDAACVNYTYMDQPALDLNYRLQAQSTLGNVTENYDEALLVDPAAVAGIVHLAEASDDAVNRGGRLSAIPTTWLLGQVVVNEPLLSFARVVGPDGPFDPLQLGLQVVDTLDSVALSGLDMNVATTGDCIAAANCDSHTLGAVTRVVYGRLMVLPSYGPETRDLDVSLEAQAFNAGVFQQHQLDNCSSYASGLVSFDLATYTGNLVDGDTNPLAPVASTGLVNGADDSLAPLLLSAPGIGNDGSVNLILDVPAWLEFDWLGTGAQDPAGPATFGRFRGHDRIIYWSEQ
ncbi:MAG: hypothetical protein OES38_02290 [Gammaproteobacteria bacterium]|nr:hypothetical protein [Gammaproteobacteria bacterium]